jgi:hypothetical protein
MALIKIEPYIIDTTGDFTFNNVTATGNLSSLNANLGNTATANFFSGSGNNLSNIAGSNVSGQVGNALVSGTVYTNAQPNITSVGTLTGITSTGTADLTGASNVALGPVANVHITGGTNGYVLQTDGSGTLSWVAQSGGGSASNISNGNSNVNIPTANGNINFSAVGNANVVVITGTGANISGTANVTGNLVAGNITAGAGSGGSITGGNLVSANYFTGTLTTNAQPNITSVGSLTSLTVTGNITSGNANLGNLATANYFIGNFYGTANSATTAGTVTTNAQPNITSVGTLTTLSVTGNGAFGNVNAGNLLTANYSTAVITTAAQPNITSIGSLTGLTVSNITGVVDFTTTANVTLGAVGNLHISGGTNAYVLSTDGAGTLSWVAQSGGGSSNISNGNSNVNIPSANGNINFSAVGNANVVVITGTGINVAGTLNVTGQSNLGAVGNVKITGGTANYILSTDGSGNLSWAAPPTSANVTVDNFTGNGVQTIFTLSTTPIGINQTSVNYNGATVLRTDYTLANANITFSSAPANGSYIEVTTINLTAGGGGGSALTIQDEGSNLTTTASLINFVGNGVTANATGNSVTVTVSGGTSAAAAVGYSLIFGG